MDFFSINTAYAASTDLDRFLGNVNREIINPLILLLFALALVYFLYGMLEFISNASNDEKKTTGKVHMLWGVVGLTIMMGVWAILSMILNTVGIPKSEIDPQEGTVDLQL